MEFNFNYFKTMEPMKYYDCGGDYDKPKAQAMLNNEGGRYIATQKYDGEWAMFIKGMNGEILIRSRSLSVVTGEYGDKTAHLPHLVNEMQDWPNGSVLLGELCFEDPTKTSKDVGTILRCLAPKAVERQKTNPLSVKVFDLLAWDGAVYVDHQYEERFNWLFTQSFCFVDFFRVTNHSRKDFMDFAESIWAQGGEGIVIHGLDFKYDPGTRTSWHSLKVKKTLDDFEVKVIRTEAPTKLYDGKSLQTWEYYAGHLTNLSPEAKVNLKEIKDKSFFEDWYDAYAVTKLYFYGWAGAIVVNYKGKEVNISSGLTDEDREWLVSPEAKKMIQDGKLIAVISGMEETADGSIRHPVLIRLRTEA